MAPITPDNDDSPNLAHTGEREQSPMPGESAPIPQEPAPSAVGIALAQARKANDKTLEQIAGRLRIKVAFLEALEAGDTQALPGHVYALGFVRSYAEYLDLDPVQAVADYKQEAADLAHLTGLSFPTPAPPRSTNGIPLMVVLGAMSLAGLAGWFATQSNTILVADAIQTPPGLSNADVTIITDSDAATARPSRATPHIATALLDIARPKSPASQVSPAPQLAARQPLPTTIVSKPIPWPAYVLPLDVVAALKHRQVVAKAPPPTPVRRPVQEAAASNNKPVAKTVAKAKPDITSTEERPVAAPKPGKKAATEVATLNQSTAPAAALSNSIPAATPVAAAPTPSQVYIPAIPDDLGGPDQGRAYGQANRDARIVIAAEADIWIQIRDRDQNDLFTRLLCAGDSYRVPNRPDLSLFTGNAGGLRLTVDGKPIAPLGADGAVRRNVALNADHLLSGTTTQ